MKVETTVEEVRSALELDPNEFLRVQRERVGRVLKWVDGNSESVTPPLTIRSDMFEVARAFLQLDVHLIVGGGLPEAWVKALGSSEESSLEVPEGVVPVIVFERSQLAAEVVWAFQSIVGPISVPFEFEETRTELSRLLSHAVFDGMTPRGGFYWALWCGTNGRYMFETDAEGVVERVCYREA